MYVHFPSDVLAAAVLGVVIGELVFRYGNRLLDRHKLLTVNLIPPTVSPSPRIRKAAPFGAAFPLAGQISCMV